MLAEYLPTLLFLIVAAGIGVALQPDIQDIVSGIAVNMEGS